jgi:hypothetical protein
MTRRLIIYTLIYIPDSLRDGLYFVLLIHHTDNT